jgi:hypothetical protein
MALPGIIIRIGAQTQDAVQGINRVNKALGRTMTSGQKTSAVIGKMGPALAAVGAAAGAFAVKLGVDAVQAAVADEKSVASLNQTLQNLGMGFKTVEVNAFVSDLQKLYGVADSDLRPAFDRLVRSTKDVGEAERALQLAVDASASGQYDLLAVANALGKGYDGNTTALGKLGLGLDKATLKTGDMNAITAAMAQTFAGKAATNAETMSGRLDRISEAAAEASEQVGYALVDAMDNLAGSTDGAISAIDTTGDELATLVGLLGDTTAAIADLKVANEESNAAGEGSTGWIEWTIGQLPLVGDAIVEVLNARQREADAAGESARAQQAVTARYTEMANAAYRAARGINAATQAQTDAAVAATWNSGYVTTREQHDENYRRGKQRAAAAKRKARQAAKRQARRDAVRQARASEAVKRRASSRTGNKMGSTPVNRGKRTC